MILTIVSWGVLLIYSVVLGYGVLQLPIYRKAVCVQHLEFYVVVGLMLETVYAQIYSLFSGVSIDSFIGISMLVLGTVVYILLINIRKKKTCVKQNEVVQSTDSVIQTCIQMVMKLDYIKVVFALFGIFLFAAITSEYCQHPDTALYHSQAIRWIEEYGLVKGLGNLHCRFAYNSALMPLQALFSFKWLIGQSMHTLTGFVCCMFFLYACFTNHFVRGQKLDISDCLRFAMIVYIYRYRNTISSPGTDIITLLMVCYCFIKWYETVQIEKDTEIDQTLLSLIVLWVISLKVSAALLVLLVSIPIVKVLRSKKWRFAFGHIMLGILVVLPWLIRNVLISGYLLYPLGGLDLFAVDWKIPKDVMTLDSHYITTYGRETQRIDTLDYSVIQWFPVWWSARTIFEKGIAVLGFIGVVLCIIQLIKFIRKKEWEYSILNGTVIAALAYWLISAPLMRYGMMFLLIAASFGIGFYLNKMNSNLVVAAFAVIILFITCNFYARIDAQEISKIYQMDYAKVETAYSVENLSGYEVYIPDNSCGSYELFPACPTQETFNRLELRGTELKQGFRMQGK